MKKKIIITYNWWNVDDQIKEIRSEVQSALEESAMARIIEQMNNGLTSGELQDTVRMCDEDGPDGIQYSGWFEITTENCNLFSN